MAYKVEYEEYRNCDVVTVDHVAELSDSEDFREIIHGFFRRGYHVPSHKETVAGTTAHIWVSGHGDENSPSFFEVLVIEPNGTRGPGQYEVAIRFPNIPSDGRWFDHNADFQYIGYEVGYQGLHGRGGLDH